VEQIRKEFLLDVDQDGEFVETKIPITLNKDGENHIISIDGVTWAETTNKTHAAVLFELMKDNITDYMNYKTV